VSAAHAQRLASITGTARTRRLLDGLDRRIRREGPLRYRSLAVATLVGASTVPRGTSGVHLAMRRAVISNPSRIPFISTASMEYCEHVGW
jgi:hypothetical protein